MSTLSTYDQQALEFLQAANVQISFTYAGFKKYFSDDKQARNIFKWSLNRDNASISGSFGSSIADSCKPTSILDSNSPVEIYAGVSITPKITNQKQKTIYFSITINTSTNVLKRVKDGDIEAASIINLDELALKYDSFVKGYKEVAKKETGGILSSLNAASRFVESKIMGKIKDLEKETVLLDQADKIIEPSAYDLLACITKYDPGTFEEFCSEFGYDTDSRKAEATYMSVMDEWNKVKGFFTLSEIELLQEIQ